MNTLKLSEEKQLVHVENLKTNVVLLLAYTSHIHLQ